MASSYSSSRRQANTSDESQESSVTFTSSSSLESVIDSTVPGRLGFPSPLPPHCPSDEKPETSLPDKTKTEILSKVSQLLNYRRVAFRSMFLVSRQATAHTSSKCPTVLVDGPVRDDDSWYIILRDIREYLSKTIPQAIAVEIIDLSLFVLPIHFPVEKIHPIVPVWGEVLRNIIREINSPLWSSISCVRRGQERSKSPVTIVLTSKCPSELRQEEYKITQIIRAYSLSGIEVQFLEVESLFANGNDKIDLEKIPPAKSYVTSNALYMGASVGIKDNPTSSATIGGQIILSYGNKKHYFGVTNSHVVSIEKPGQGISPFLLYGRC